MGVTQYEIPLDSRIAAWVRSLPSPFAMDSARLYAGIAYYESKITHIQSICRAAGVLPCELDAAVFISADSQEWPADDNVF